MISVLYTTVDRCRVKRQFKTLAGAQRFAHKWLGETPEIGSYYAVSSDGIGKIECAGCTLYELFPKLALVLSHPPADPRDAAHEAWNREQADDHDDCVVDAHPKRAPGCTCSDNQLIHVGCDCPRDGTRIVCDDPLDDMPF
jgi:hypothetical protein